MKLLREVALGIGLLALSGIALANERSKDVNHIEYKTQEIGNVKIFYRGAGSPWGVVCLSAADPNDRYFEREAALVPKASSRALNCRF